MMRIKTKSLVLGVVLFSPVLGFASLSPSSTVAVSTVAVSTPVVSGVCQDTTENCSSTASWQSELEAAKSSWGTCEDDVNKFCEGIQVGAGRIEECLKKHKSKLTKKCRQAQGLK